MDTFFSTFCNIFAKIIYICFAPLIFGTAIQLTGLIFPRRDTDKKHGKLNIASFSGSDTSI